MAAGWAAGGWAGVAVAGQEAGAMAAAGAMGEAHRAVPARTPGG